jgi:lactoylglutathione lyase
LRPNGSNIAFLKAGSCLLELIQPADMSLTGRCAGVIDHICIEVDDIEMEIKKLKKNEIISAHAVAGVLPDMRGGFKNLFFTGPDGERLEYLQSL